MTATAPQCGKCRHGKSKADTFDAPASYALVLYTGATALSSAVGQADAEAFLEMVPGASAFCSMCQRVTWLSRHDDVAMAVLDFRHRWNSTKRMRMLVLPPCERSLQTAECDAACEDDEENRDEAEHAVRCKLAGEVVQLGDHQVNDSEDADPEQNGRNENIEAGLLHP